MIAQLLEPWRGDFEAMVERRVIRALVTFNRTNYFLDGGRQRGITADALLELEKTLNRKLSLGNRPMHVAAIPVRRDQLLPFLEAGRGDLAVASLSITELRRQTVDFSVPVRRNVKEVVVAGPSSPAIASLDDLAGMQIHVRRSSSYWESLAELSRSFRSRGMPAAERVAMDEALETEDLLEMVSAGLLPITVADDYLATFWSQLLPELDVREDLAIRSDGELAWAIRPDADGLKPHIDRFVDANRTGTLLGNILLKRYLKSTRYVRNSLAAEDRRRFNEMLDLFRKYGARYELDPLLLAAQGYQESRLDQSVVSRVGAVGVMQVLPSTAADPAVGIADIEDLENNIHAGAKYLRLLVDRYFDDPEIDPMNRSLLAFAGYNAGPNRINRLRRKAVDMDLDPNVWFRNVELVVAREVGREPVQYVSNIFKYYTVYRLFVEQQAKRREVKATVE